MRYSTLPYYTGSLSEESAQLNVDVVFWGASLVSQTVKNMPAMRETWVWFLGWEDPLEKKWQSTPVYLPGKSYGHRSLAGYSQWGHKELNTTEQLNTHTRTHIHSVLSMFKVRKPMLRYRFISLNAFSAYEGFIRRWCYHKLRWIYMCIHTCLCINVLAIFFQCVCVNIYIFTYPYYHAHKVLESA